MHLGQAPIRGAAGRAAANPATSAADITFVPTQFLARRRAAEAADPLRRFVTFADFTDRAHGVLGPGTAWLGDLGRDRAIRAIIRRRAEANPTGVWADLKDRPGIRRALADLIPDLKTRGVRPAHLADLHTAPGPLSAEIPAVYADYCDEVRDAGDHPWAVAAALRDRAKLPAWLAGVSAFAVEDTDLLTASQRALLAALAGRFRLTYRWPFARDLVMRLPILAAQAKWLDDLADAHPGRVAVEFPPDEPADGDLARLRRTLFRFDPPAASRDRTVHLIAAPDAVAEADAVARDIRRRLQSPDAPAAADIAVVLGDAADYRPVLFERFARNGVPFYSRGGETLARRAVFRFLRKLFGLPLRKFDAREVLSVLQNGYARFQHGPEAEALFAKLNYGGPADDESLAKRMQRRAAQFERDRKRLTEDPPDPNDPAAAETSAQRLDKLETAWQKEQDLAQKIQNFLGRIRGWAALKDAHAMLAAADDICENSVRIPGGPDEEDDYRTLQQVQSIIREQKESWPAGSELSAGDWLEETDALAERRVLSDIGDPDGVQIVTVQEISGRRFGLVYVPGLTAGTFPRRERTDPFLSEPARAAVSVHLRALGLPDLPAGDDDTQRDRIHFARAVYAAGREMVLTVPITPETMEESPPGEFYADAEFLFHPDPDGVTTLPRRTVAVSETVPAPAEAATRADLHAGLSLELFEPRPAKSGGNGHAAAAAAVYTHLARTTPQAVALWLRAAAVERLRRAAMRTGDPHVYAGRFAGAISVLHAKYRTADGGVLVRGRELDTFGSCPFHFIAGSVLHLRSPAPPDGEIPPKARGDLVHRVMERFYGDPARRSVPPNRKTDGPALVELIREEVAALHDAGITPDPAMGTLLRAELEQRLPAALDDDGAFRDEQGCAPVLLEYPVSAVEVDVEGTRMLINGRIDRVDRTADGAAVVIDYKDSSSKAENKKQSDVVAKFDLGSKVQVALYALALQNEKPGKLQAAGWAGGAPAKTGGAYYNLKAQKGNIVQKMSAVFDEPGWKDKILKHLSRYGEALAGADFPAHPVADACGFCDWAAVCRHPEDVKTRGGEHAED